MSIGQDIAAGFAGVECSEKLQKLRLLAIRRVACAWLHVCSWEAA